MTVDPWTTRLAEQLGPLLLQTALSWFHTFVLVLMRVSGLMIVGPVFGQAVVPANVRILLAVSLAFLLAPVVQQRTALTFRELDENHDGRLVWSETPPQLHERFKRLCLEQGKNPETASLNLQEFCSPGRVPRSLLGLAAEVTQELALGFILGLGMLTVLSGLQLAGQIIDQQTGLVLGEVFNPGLELEGTLSGQFLYLFGVTVFLVAPPLNGHLLILSALLDTFRVLPPGDAVVMLSTWELIRNLLHESFVLAIQVAAPTLAVVSLIALALGFLGHTVPQINILVVGFAVRAMLCFAVLAAAMSGIGYLVADRAVEAVDLIRTALTGLP